MKYKMPDIVINRTRDFKVSQFYESQGIRIYNPAYLTYIGNNKYEAVKYLSEHITDSVKNKKWTAQTLLIKSKDIAKILSTEYMQKVMANLGCFGKDIVIKSVDGHGGNEVFLLEVNSNLKKRREIVNKLSGHDCIIQEKIDSDSSDIRVYIIGGKIYAAMLRTGGNDFRSNYSLYGNAEEYKLNDIQKNYVMEFVKALGSNKIGMAGIDFILTRDGQMLFNEVEEMAGSRMLYERTSYDIVKDYVHWIFNVYDANGG